MHQQSSQAKPVGNKPTAGKSAVAAKANIAIMLVISLFFIWGLTMNLVNALNAPFSHYLQLSGTQTALLQVAYFGAYFVMAIPAGMIAKRFGYKGGVISGLALFALGALLVIPATNLASFALFLGAMFVIALGAASLETNCNPYVTKLGDERGESFRLNLAQSFNAVGSVIAPVILGQLLAKTVQVGSPDFAAARTLFLGHTRMIYIVLAVVLVAVLLIFVFFRLPSPPGDTEGDTESSAAKAPNAAGSSMRSLLAKPYVTLGILAEFVFIGLQVAGMALFSSFAIKHWGVSGDAATGIATTMLAVLTVMFALGRFITTPLMAKLDPRRILGSYMLIAAALMAVVALGLGKVSVIAFIVAYLFISIGYPTIFSLTLSGIHSAAAKTGSSLLVMSIVGAALIPLLCGALQDAAGIELALAIAVPGYLYVAWYAFCGSRMGLAKSSRAA